MIQRDIEYSGQYSKDVKLAQKRHKDMNKLKYLMTLLINNTLPLPAVYKDHPLQGSWKGYRDAHVEPDWILIYKLTDKLLRFERTYNVVDHADGDYADEPMIYQAFQPLPRFGDSYTLIGSWIVDDEACGMGIREDNTLITKDTSRFVPHYIAG